MKKPIFIKAVTILTAATMVVGTPVTALCAPIDNVMVGADQQTRRDAVVSESDKAILKSLFDAEFFAKKYPAIAEALGNNADAMFLYFVKFGIYEGKQPCATFDVASYAAAYSDLAAKFGTDVMSYYRHYAEYGKAEGRVLTTLDACKTAGIDTNLIEAQRFTLNEEGAPVFAKFYNESQKAFVYSEAEAKKAEAGTFSDYKAPVKSTPSVVEEQKQEQKQEQKTEEEKKKEEKKKEEKKKEEKKKKALVSYQEALDLWESRMPDPLDYMTDEEKSDYYNSIASLNNMKLILSNAQSGRMFENIKDATLQFENDSYFWADSFGSRVETSMFTTEESLGAWQSAFIGWIGNFPDIDQYFEEYELDPDDEILQSCISETEDWSSNAPNLGEAGTTQEFWDMYDQWMSERPTYDNGRYQDVETWLDETGVEVEETDMVGLISGDTLYPATAGTITQFVGVVDEEGNPKAVKSFYDVESAAELTDDPYTEEEAEEAREQALVEVEEDIEYYETFDGKSNFAQEDSEHLIDDTNDWFEHEPEEGKEDYSDYTCPEYPSNTAP